MSLWSRVEQTLESLVEGVFRKGLRGGLQPVEIARQLQRAMEEQRHVSVSHTYVPNEFTVKLHPDDLTELRPILRTLTREFTAHLAETAAKDQLSFVGNPAVAFTPSDEVPPGTLKVEAHFLEGLIPEREEREGDAEPSAGAPRVTEPGCTQRFRASRAADAPGDEPDRVETGDEATPSPRRAALVLLDPDGGRKFPLSLDQPVVIGRGNASDIALADSSVSREHARIEPRDGRCHIVDLGSTNGTFVNGNSISDAALQDGDHIRIGEYSLRFEGDE